MAAGSTDIGRDALLVAYLDDELDPQAHEQVEQLLQSDPAARAHLAALAEGGRPFRPAFDALLDAAPRERMEAALSAALLKAARRKPDRYRRALIATAAALMLLVGGGTAGYFIAKAPNLFEQEDEVEEAWIDAVAGQLALYDASSVANIKVDAAEQKAELDRLGEAVKLDLSEKNVSLEGLTLKRAELLHFQGRDVAQLLYASDKHGPVALCIMSQPGGEEEGEVESRDGLNYTYWSSGGRRFLLIGAAPEQSIDALGDTVRDRFGA
jgi:anti-sigma factor RsiW